MIDKVILERTGAKRPSEVPEKILKLLNSGILETVNLSEWLAVDQVLLFTNVFQDLKLAEHLRETVEQAISMVDKPSANTYSKVIGQALEHHAENSIELMKLLSSHNSDSVRCWAAHMIGVRKVSMEEKLADIKRFAADPHFGVREISFMAVKKDIASHLSESIAFLKNWTSNEDENVRRFSVEATRPIGVWTNKIDQLKEKPEQGLILLSPLKSDPSKYVRDAVANWLNDASKSKPEWVRGICDQWLQESDSRETAYIVKRALRTLDKKQKA